MRLNSTALSERRLRGAPCEQTSRDNTSATRPEQIEPATSIAEHSRVFLLEIFQAHHIGYLHPAEMLTRLFFIASIFPLETILSIFNWSENRQASYPAASLGTGGACARFN